MKKLLIAALALITALSISLAACDKKKDPEPADDDPDDDLVARPSDDNNDSTPSDDDDKNNTNNGNSTTLQWETKNDTVYVLTGCNIRSSANTNSSRLGTAKLGDSFQRLETNGEWSKITYNNAEAYILNDLLTESVQRVTFTDRSSENLVLHVKSNGNTESPIQTNLRNAPTSKEAAKSLVASITAANTANGEMKLLALSQDGEWARVSYTGTIGSKTFNGSETLYVYYDYIQELNPSNSGDQLPG